MKRKKLRSNPLRKARLSFEEIKSLAWDTEQGSRKKDSRIAHLRSLLAVPYHPGRLRTASMEAADGVQD